MLIIITVYHVGMSHNNFTVVSFQDETFIAVFFNFGFMVMSVVSVCTTVLVLAMHFADPIPDVPLWLEKLLLKKTTKVGNKMMEEDAKNYKLEVMSVASLDGNQNPNPSCTEKSEDNQQNLVKENWKRLARIVNKVFFLIFVTTYVVIIVSCAVIWSEPSPFPPDFGSWLIKNG